MPKTLGFGRRVSEEDGTKKERTAEMTIHTKYIREDNKYVIQ